MAEGILFGCGDFSVYDLYRLRCVTDGYVQPIVIENAAKDLPIAVQTATSLNGIIQQIGQHLLDEDGLKVTDLTLYRLEQNYNLQEVEE